MPNIPENWSPTGLHLIKSEALEISWSIPNNSPIQVRYPLRFLRKHCPCASCKGERDLLGRTLLPVLKTTYDGPLTAKGGELVGNYALRITWSDDHDSGIYSWKFLRQLAALLDSDSPAAK